ncbi:hypothetical protein HY573_02715 [Candidatus Parcubacteria bacterium]|nr:hypothetical protein [Candidatus Parcubacteria bacterium]
MECEEAASTLFFLDADWSVVKAAVQHIARCRTSAVCVDLWRGWEQCVERALQLHARFGSVRSGTEPLGECVRFRRSFREPMLAGCLCEATLHALACSQRDCFLVRWALFEYFRVFGLVSGLGQYFASTPEMPPRPGAAEP